MVAVKNRCHTWLFLFLLLPLLQSAQTNRERPSYLNYIQNKGQWDDQVLYRSSFAGGTVFLENAAFTFLFYENNLPNKIHHALNTPQKKDSVQSLSFHAVKLQFTGASASCTVKQQTVQPFYHNYFLGNDPAKWTSRVPVCKGVTYKNIYTGIDVSVFGNGNNVRYDFNISAGGNPSDIHLLFTGQDKLFLRDGKLVITTSVGEIEQQQPYGYQASKNGTVKPVACSYALTGNALSIHVTGPYDKTLPLIIDPTLVFSTYTGSTGDNWGMSATYDISGNGYTTGECFAPGYPLSPGAFQTTYAGSMHMADMAISKFNPSGSQLLFSTYLGGNNEDTPHSLTVDNDDNLLVFGHTHSDNFPVKQGSYDVTQNGDLDISVTKFNATGTALLASTFIGGTDSDGENVYPLDRNYGDNARGAIHVDENNDVYIVACTSSPDFPVTAGCLQPTKAGDQDACVFKLNANLSALIFSTYLGGSSNDAAYNFSFDSQNTMYITGGTISGNFPTTPGVLHPSHLGGIDGFITHLSGSGNAILQSSYIGTFGYDQSYFIQTDKRDNVYLYGQSSGNYPVTAGVYSNPTSGQFIHKLDPTLATTLFSTEFGTGKGHPDISPSAFLVDNCDNIYVSGWGGSFLFYGEQDYSISGMPLSSDALQTTTDGSDFYFAVFTRNAATLHYGTYFGGNNSEEHVDGGTSCYDKSGVIYQAICAGCGGHSDTPTTPGAWSVTNNSQNCNNALVKFSMDLRPTVAQIYLRPFIKTGCQPFTLNFLNNSINAVNYLWNFNDGTTSAAIAPAHTFTNAGTYTVTLVASNLVTCNQADTTHIVIKVVPPSTLTQMPPFKTCKNDSVHLQVSVSSAYGFTWQPAGSLSNPFVYNPVSLPLSTTVYSVTVKDSICQSTNTTTVKVNVYENITHITSNQIGICTNDSVKLGASRTYSAYLWSNGQTSAFINTHIPGWYQLVTTDSSGCKGTDSLKVSGLSIVRLDPQDITLCRGQSAQLVTPTGSYKYHWSPSIFLSGDTIYNPVATPDSSVIYTVIVSNDACKNSARYSLLVNSLPHISVSQKTITAIIGESIVLNATADTTCYWSPGDWLSCDSCKTTIATPENNTIYTCRVTSKAGCMSAASVVVELAPTLYVPNTFTPNDDDLNDVFKPLFTGYTKMTVTIYDRWGAELYTYSNLDGGWNGRYKGSPAKMDVYVYKIDATDFRNKRLEKSGFVTLLR